MIIIIVRMVVYVVVFQTVSQNRIVRVVKMFIIAILFITNLIRESDMIVIVVMIDITFQIFYI